MDFAPIQIPMAVIARLMVAKIGNSPDWGMPIELKSDVEMPFDIMYVDIMTIELLNAWAMMGVHSERLFHAMYPKKDPKSIRGIKP